MKYVTMLCAVCMLIASPLPLAAQAAETDSLITLDFKNTDIQDAFRIISRGSGLNVVLDSDVSGKVTLHLTRVTPRDGLKTLCELNGLEMDQEGSVIRVHKAREKQRTVIHYHNGKLTVDAQNVEIKEFLKDLSAKTAVSIVPGTNIEGKVSGKLYQVDFYDGLRALLEANDFIVTKRKNIYQVTAQEQEATGRSSSRSRFRGRSRYQGSRAGFFVDFEDDRISLDISKGDLGEVIKAITEQGEVEIITYGNVTGEVNAKIDGAPLSEALALLLGGTRYTFIQRNGIILIGDRNAASPSGQALSTSELIHLDHIKAEEVPKALPKNIPAANIKIVKEQNALLVSGTSEDIVNVRDFLETIDIPTPQVRIDAIILEYKENLDKEVGINYWRRDDDNPKSSYLSMPSPPMRYDENGSSVFEFGGGVNLRGLTRDLQKALDRLNLDASVPESFFAALRFLESQDKAKILAQPSIMTLNGHKATINVGETQYFKITTGVAENYTVRFQPIKFGIQLNITPWISRSGQITVDIAPEVSNSEKTNAEGYPNVSTRALSTTVRINDGETLVLGGLLKNQETTFEKKVPFLGSIPLIGALFRHKGTTRIKSNLVIYLTPHVVTREDTVNIEQEFRKYSMSDKNVLEKKLLNMLNKLRHRKDDIGTEKDGISDSAMQTLPPPVSRNAADTAVAKKRSISAKPAARNTPAAARRAKPSARPVAAKDMKRE